MLTALLAKLEHEQYDESMVSWPGGVQPTELEAARDTGYRRGWNARARDLAQWLRMEMALAEMKASDVQ